MTKPKTETKKTAPKKKIAPKTIKTAEPSYTKEQILKSRTLSYNRDVLFALLDDGKVYTLQEVDNLVSKFLKRKVT